MLEDLGPEQSIRVFGQGGAGKKSMLLTALAGERGVTLSLKQQVDQQFIVKQAMGLVGNLDDTSFTMSSAARVLASYRRMYNERPLC